LSKNVESLTVWLIVSSCLRNFLLNEIGNWRISNGNYERYLI